MYRLQFHFETVDDELHETLLAGAKESARLAVEKGIEPPTVWVSEDERPRRVVIEFTGTDKFDAHAKSQKGNEDPDIGPLLAELFKGRLTTVEVYGGVDTAP